MVDPTENNEIKPERPASEDAVDLSPDKDGGVMKEILRVGSGEEGPMSGDVVSVHYVGTLFDDCSQFDSSRDRGEFFTFNLGKGEVIKAWDLGVASMKKGELCRLICQGPYAYGLTGSPPKIPPSATLVFEIELFSWKGEDLSHKKDGGITRRIIEPGSGHTNPNEGALVEINLTGHVNNTIFDERTDLKFIIGEGPDHNIPEGLERALEKFKLGEKSKIYLTPKYTFGSDGHAELGIPPNSDVEYTVELKSFEKAKECWQMSQEEKIDQAVIFKEKGTVYFKNEKFRQAVKQYKKITTYLSYDSGLDDVKKEESHALKLAGHLNLSMCYLKLNDYINAQEQSDEAIKMDPANVKAHFRRGQSMLNTNYPEDAIADFQKCLSLDPDNKAAKTQLHACQKQINELKRKEKQMYGGMFDRFAKVDARKQAAMNNGNVMSGDLGEWAKEEGNKDDTKEKADSDAEEYDFNDINDIKMI